MVEGKCQALSYSNYKNHFNHKNHLNQTTNSVSTQLFRASFKKNIPLDVIVELTKRCNLNCVHCYIPDKHRNKTKDLTTNQWKHIFNQLADVGCLYLALTGGEIFLRNDVLELVNYARNKDFVVTLFTNGTLLDTEKIKEIKNLALWEVHITLYSVKPEIHDKITRVKNSCLTTINTIRKLRSYGVNLVIKTPLMKLNFSGYPKVLSFANRLEAKVQFDPVITPKNNGDKNPLKYRVNKQQLEMFYRDKNVFDSRQTTNDLRLTTDDKRPTTNDKRPTTSDHVCSAGRNLASITAKGLVYPCLQFPVVLGDLKTSSFQKIWVSKNNQRIKKTRNLKLPVICQNCVDLNHCNRCPGLALLEEESVSLPSKIACRIARIRRPNDE